jgi:uncharacterized protein YdbL (DUF1318 family)
MPKRARISDDIFARVDAAKPVKTAAKPSTTYRIDPAVRDALRELAKRERVSPADLAEVALRRFLDDVEAGRYVIAKDPDTYKVRR